MVLSVRFYRRLFIAILAAAIIIPTIFAVVFGISATKAKAQIVQLNEETSKLQNELAVLQKIVGSEEESIATNPVSSSKNPLDYQTLFPTMYVKDKKENTVYKEKAVYLTFDDGPCENTKAILDTLDLYQVKATFFIVGNGRNNDESKAIMKDIVNRGHTIGVHSWSHNYPKIYASVESFLEDFEKTYQLIYEATGVRAEIFRFPGGSINAYNQHIYQEIIAEMTRRGFTYYDWNVSAADASNGATTRSIYDSIMGSLPYKSRSIVLLHDTKVPTAKVLPDIIESVMESGFTFYPLTSDIEPTYFSYPR